MVDIAVIGSLTIDMTTFLQGAIPQYGYSTNSDEFVVDFGGKGGNLAVMPRLLGSSVLMIAKVGNDMFGNNYRSHLEQLSVETSAISVCETAKTGVGQILVNKLSGEYSAIVYSGANGRLSVQDVHAAEEQLASAKCLIVSILTPFDAALEALRIAKQNGLTTVLNPAPTHFAARLRGSSHYDEFLRLSDMICPNFREAAALVGESCDAEPALVVERLHVETSRVGNADAVVMATLGKRGVAFWNAETDCVELVHTDPVTAVDTTGAGDCFVGALVHFLVHHKHLAVHEKIRRAAKIASVSVTRPGTQSSYPKRAELPPELFE